MWSATETDRDPSLMDPFERVKRLLLPIDDDSIEINECQDCGELVSPQEETCPNCESVNIAEYSL